MNVLDYAEKVAKWLNEEPQESQITFCQMSKTWKWVSTGIDVERVLVMGHICEGLNEVRPTGFSYAYAQSVRRLIEKRQLKGASV